MNEVSLNTIRKYIEFNAKENPQSDFVSCSHTNNKISNNFFSIGSVPPMNANGIEPIK